MNTPLPPHLNIPVQTTTPAPIANLDAQEGPPAPPPGGVGSAPAGLAQAPTVTPPPVGVSAQPLTPILFAGFTLAKIVLGITAGSIVLLLSYLLWMESVVATDVRDAYQKVLSPSRIGAEFRTISELEKLSTDLSATRKNAAVQWTPDSLQNAEAVLKLVNELPSVTADQKTQFKNCVPPPLATDVSRDNKIDTCIAMLGAIKQGALEAVAAATDAKVAADSSDKISGQRLNLHTFWVQAAQLILLNLLLPLLTALFGYIFGTQQAQKT